MIADSRVFGGIVRGHRRRLGLSQEDLAEKARVSERTIRKLEADLIKAPRPATVQLLADAFGLTGADREDFCLAAGRPAEAAPATDRPTPAQLPADVSGFVGRADHLDRLSELTDDSATPGPLLISAIAGTAGVGKTALAVRWAHRVRARFPDGQLFVDLRGYDPREPVTVGQALAGFLHALGRGAADIPVDIDERAAAYRSLVAGRRMLVVLDNAATVDQVRPLLPGSPTCVVLVTSRDALPGLVARNGARRVELDALALPEAVELLRTLIGDRADVDPAATVALAEHCCRLPLALRIAAEVAAGRPGLPLARLAGELADRGRRLDVLDLADDPQAAVRSVFSWSYQRLPAEAARTFRLLGSHPGTDFDAHSVAALTGAAVADATRELAILVRGHLVQQQDRRYTLHDLLRAYAAELSAGSDPAGVARLIDYYVVTAAAAMDTLHPAESQRRPQVAAGDLPVPVLVEATDALSWLDRERPTLISVAGHAAENGWPEQAVRISTILFRYLESGGHHLDALTVHSHALRAAKALGATADQGYATMNLGTVGMLQGRFEEAATHYRAAHELFRAVGDQAGEARALGNLGMCISEMGQVEEAVGLYLRARELCAAAGDLIGEGRAWGNVATVYSQLGDEERSTEARLRALEIFRRTGERGGEARMLANHASNLVEQGRADEAIEHFFAAVALFRATGHRRGEAHTLNNLGAAYSSQHRHADAIEHHEQALLLLRDAGDQGSTAETLVGLGRTLCAAGRADEAFARLREGLSITSKIGRPFDAARAHDGLAATWCLVGAPDRARDEWRQALEIFTAIGAPEADAVRANLEALELQSG